MYAMCHTKSDDVRDCIEKMKRQRITGWPLFQVGQKLYKRCEKDHNKALEIAQNKKRGYAINMASMVLHKASCPSVKRIKRENLVSAYLVRPKDANLTMCVCCLK